MENLGIFFSGLVVRHVLLLKNAKTSKKNHTFGQCIYAVVQYLRSSMEVFAMAKNSISKEAVEK